MNCLGEFCLTTAAAATGKAGGLVSRRVGIAILATGGMLVTGAGISRRVRGSMLVLGERSWLTAAVAAAATAIAAE